METDEAVTVLARSGPGPENPRRILFYLSVVAALAYGALLIQNLPFGFGSADASGHANAARLILTGRATAPIDALDLLGLPDRFASAFIPIGFTAGPRPRTMAPSVAPGFAAHVALFSLVAGWEAGPFVVTPIAAILGLAMLYALARELGLSRLLSLAGAAILAAGSAYLLESVQPTGEVVAVAWSLAAILFAVRARRRRSWAWAAGAAFGVAVLVRPADLLLVFPLVFALPWSAGAFALFAAGAAPFGALGLLWNHAAHGSALPARWAAPTGSGFGPRASSQAGRLIAQLSALIPLGWLASAADRRIAGRDRALLFLWFAAFFVFDGFFGSGSPAEPERSLGPLLPALPALVLAFLLVVRDLLHRLPEREAGGPRRHLRAAAVVLVLLVVGTAEWRTALLVHPLRAARGQTVFRDGCRWLAEKAGERSAGKALIVSRDFSGAVRFYTDFPPLRWDRVTPEDFEAIRSRAAERGYRIFGAALPEELGPARPHVPGRWTLVQRFDPATIWRLD